MMVGDFELGRLSLLLFVLPQGLDSYKLYMHKQK
jgi:hypothetical protein